MASDAFPPWAPTPGERIFFPSPTTDLTALILSGLVAGAMKPSTPHSTPSLAISSACCAVNMTAPGWLISVTA